MKTKMAGLFLLVTNAAMAHAQGAAQPGGPFGGGLVGMAPWIMIFAVFYFLLIRPQQKQANEQKKMLNALKRGDRILTQGGLYGTISAVKGKALEIKLNDEVKVYIARSAVSQVVGEDPAKEPESAVVAN